MGGPSGYAAILAHAGGVLYGAELGSVTLKRVGLFCVPIKHSTHTVITLALNTGNWVPLGPGPGVVRKKEEEEIYSYSMGGVSACAR